jgi:hypothetical protein
MFAAAATHESIVASSSGHRRAHVAAIAALQLEANPGLMPPGLIDATS